jgi:hypothetical protein
MGTPLQWDQYSRPSFESLRMTFESLRMTFESLRMTFESLRMTFESLRMTWGGVPLGTMRVRRGGGRRRWS